MPKFSPGPWKVRYRNAYCHQVLNADGHHILTVKPTNDHTTIAQDDANVGLIVLAPQMYDLLVELQAVATGEGGEGEEDDGDLTGQEADAMCDIGRRAYHLLKRHRLLPKGESDA